MQPAGLRNLPRLLLRRGLRRLGVDIVRHPTHRNPWPRDASKADIAILKAISGCTMTSVDRQLALIHATRHIVRESIAGCMVECGVWRGGSAMAMALALRQEGAERDLMLYDTFEGMTSPTALDRRPDGTSAQALMQSDTTRQSEVWAVAALSEVRRNLAATGYPQQRLHLIQGDVTETLPARAPDAPIALLRLDTDWYESTRHELVHLYPRVVAGGIVLIDDYGDWEGARRAVDEFMDSLPQPRPLLQRIDATGRLIIKPSIQDDQPVR